MKGKTDKTVDLLKLIRGPGGQQGLKIVKVDTTDPDPITLVFEGTPLPLDLEIFEIPVDCYPLRKGDRLLAYRLVGTENGQRWAAFSKLSGGVTLATMTGAASCQVEGIGREYTAQDLIVPPYFLVGDAATRYADNDGGATVYSDYYLTAGDARPLQAGDTVSLAPTLEDGTIKYVILERY
jgi:hypothetical protein